jgi:cytochrome c oxidase subunit 3
MATITLSERKEIRGKAAIPLLWIGMVSMIMLFAAFTSAYVVRKGKGEWLDFEMPQIFYFSTAIIMISSVTMNWALASAKKNNLKNIRIASFITLALGLTFVICQFKGWGVLVDNKVYAAGKFSNPAGSFFYLLTALHALHLFAGIISVAVVSVKSLFNKYNSENYLGIKLCSIFWHFLDILWIYLFVFLLFER